MNNKKVWTRTLCIVLAALMVVGIATATILALVNLL